MWNEITAPEDMTGLMSAFGNFHDSCIKEIRYVSGAFVAENLAMNPVNSKRIVDVVFQRQYKNPTAIVLRFVGLNVLHLAPCNDNYTCEIHGAAAFFRCGRVYWADCADAADGEIESLGGTWICADKLRWRAADECIGEHEIFGASFE